MRGISDFEIPCIFCLNIHGNLAVRHVLIIHLQRIIHFYGQIVFRLLRLHFRGVNSDQQIPVRRIIIGDIFLLLNLHLW